MEAIDIGLTSWKPVAYDNEMARGMYLWENGYFVNSSQDDGFAFEMLNNMWGTNYVCPVLSVSSFCAHCNLHAHCTQPQWYPFHPVDANLTYNVILYL